MFSFKLWLYALLTWQFYWVAFITLLYKLVFITDDSKIVANLLDPGMQDVKFTFTLTVQDVATDGPIPWAKKHHVAFIAEQVSHHPPSK